MVKQLVEKWDEQTQSMRQRWVKGPPTLPKVFNQVRGLKKKLFWKDDRPVGPLGHPSLFSETIGVLMAKARRYDWSKYWEQQDPDERNALWPEINKFCELDEDKQEYTLGKISSDVFRNKKSKWKSKHYSPYTTYEQRMTKKSQQLTTQEWADLVEFWDTPQEKVISERNKGNRGKQVATHTSGRISFPQLMNRMIWVIEEKNASGFVITIPYNLQNEVVWIRAGCKLPNRYWPAYLRGIEEFIDFAKGKQDGMGRIRCPCNHCNNRLYKHISEVRKDLIDTGIDKTYTHWCFHGEELKVLSEEEDDDSGGGLEGVEGVFDILSDLQRATHVDHSMSSMEHGGASEHHSTCLSPKEGNPTKFDALLREAQKPLYLGCSKLEFLVKLYHIKTINHWSNKSFDMVLQLLKDALQALPKSHYEAKTLLRNLGLGYITIHACINDSILYWKELEKLENFPKCGESRMTSADMRWHKEKRVPEENVFKHPADSKVWEEFDKEHQWFAVDPRNIRLGLASDGFNPFGNMSNAYSMWPVMVFPYNLPPWKCMKDPFLFVSLRIPGPKAPGNDIDVYLLPLVDELIDLWEIGVETYDEFTKQTFQMHAALLWTINDFPAYANLSGWSTEEKMACPTCNKDTSSMYLKNGRKLCYMNHICFVQPRQRRCFRSLNVVDGKRMLQPKKLSGHAILIQLEQVNQQFGKAPNNKKRKRTSSELNWTKKSIF